MATITIDGKEYDIDTLSDETKPSWEAYDT